MLSVGNAAGLSGLRRQNSKPADSQSSAGRPQHLSDWPWELALPRTEGFFFFNNLTQSSHKFNLVFSQSMRKLLKNQVIRSGVLRVEDHLKAQF